MGMFCFSGVYLKVNEEIKNLIIEKYLEDEGKNESELDEDDKDDILLDVIANVGGIRFYSYSDYGRKAPISNDGEIDWYSDQTINEDEDFLFISLNDSNLSKPMLGKGQTLLDVILEDENFSFIPKNYAFKEKLEFYWLDIASYDN